MIKKNKGLLIFISIFVFLQVVLDIIMVFDEFNDWFSSNLGNAIKYVSIITCFMVSTIALNTKKGHFIILGLAFTLIADYFLLVMRDYYTIGLIAFIFAQAMYFIYINPKCWKISLIIRFSIFGIIAILLPFALKITEVNAFLAAFYFINLVINTIDSYIAKDKEILMFAIGLTLFVACDIFVCLYNIKDYISISNDIGTTIKRIGFIGTWIFYIPSQTLIAISPLFREKYDLANSRQCEE